MARIRRARLQGVRRGRRQEGQVDLVPAGGEAQARRDGMVLVDRVPQPQAPRQREQEGDEGPAHHGADGSEEVPVRCQAHVLGWVQSHRRPGKVAVLNGFLIAVAAIVVIFLIVVDFQSWRAWSPWEKVDPALKRSYDGPQAGPGAVYAWQGNKDFGEGRTTITES